MPSAAIIKVLNPTSSVDVELIKAIINKLVSSMIFKLLGIYGVDVSRVRWYPGWKFDRKSKAKQLNALYVRLDNRKSFKRVHAGIVIPLGLHLAEFFEYLEKSDAIRVKCNKANHRKT